jgi:hypothetical protein
MKHAFNYIAMSAVVIFFAFTCGHLRASGSAGYRGSDTVLIVPARPAVLKLAFDIENMRDVTIVSFRARALPASPTHRGEPKKGMVTSTEPLVHVWTGKSWQYVSFDDFCTASFAGIAPGTAIVIGDDQTVPKSLLQGMLWPCKVERLQTLNTADLLNGLDKYFEFSSREWKRLSGAYGLKLEDVNASKREFNPYDIPRSKMPLETREFKQEKDDAPPAVLIEKPESQTGSKGSKQAEKPWIK